MDLCFALNVDGEGAPQARSWHKTLWVPVGRVASLSHNQFAPTSSDDETVPDRGTIEFEDTSMTIEKYSDTCIGR
jgi:hypothetical protein